MGIEGPYAHLTDEELLEQIGIIQRERAEMDERAILVAADEIRRKQGELREA
ncbi:MAG: hypothetical protein M9921_09390 [Fimbriimonadaceae bacterium]|nr:hypothetical protein [Fimbriimonadaceae bacterium]